MPIVRTYACETCFHIVEVTLTAEQWDRTAPECPACSARQMRQEFKPVAIGGSPIARAIKTAEDIAEKDYHVADMTAVGSIKEGRPKVRYKDQTGNESTWGVASETLAAAISAGKETRMQYGSGLDILQSNLKSGAEPDLIEISKRRSARIW